MPTGKHVKTEYDKLRGLYRETCPRHVVIFEAGMSEDQKRHTFAYGNNLRMPGNKTAAELNRRIEQLLRTKVYRRLLKDYGWHSEHMKNLDPESDRFKELESERKTIAAAMTKMQQTYGVTFADTRALMNAYAAEYNVGSIFTLTRAEDIWSACEKVLYGDGKRLHYRKRGDIPIIRAKQIERGITVRLDKEGQIVFHLESIGSFYAIVPEKDYFLVDEYNALCRYLTDPSCEEEAVLHMQETGELIPVFRPCYASLKCEEIRGRLRVFIQVTIAAPAMLKRRSDGSPRHQFAKEGRVGCDNGSQSFAAVSKEAVILKNTAERGGKSTKARESLIRTRQKQLARSRRATNPERFNKDGTYKKGSRGKWKKSKHCKRLQYLVREQQRRDAASRKYAVQEDANRLRELGNVLIIEPSNAKALQRRSKQATEKSSSTIEVKKKDGTVKTVHKNKRKKRFGRSVLHRCPGAFQAELQKKFGDGYHEVARNFRASQYDHVLDDCIKKRLSERWHHLPDGRKVQRDIYSAFLMYCSNSDYTTPDREACIKAFDRFFVLHEALISKIVQNHLNVCNSGIAV